MSLESILQPEQPESISHLREGYLIGPIPGLVTANDDPKKLGRVRINCPLIDPFADLPSSDDGWIPFVTPYVVNSRPGGTMGLVEIGSQVMVFPVMGRPNNWIAFACVFSTVDSPHPEFDRAAKKHGTVTANDVYDIANDSDQSRIQAYPHGVIDHVAARGDRMIQTAGEARMHLLKEGDVRMENPLSFTQMTADGTVKQRSKEGATSTLNADGTVEVKSAFDAALQLQQGESKITGPLHPIAQAMTKAKSALNGHIGQAQNVLQGLNSIVADLDRDGSLDAVELAIAKADKFLGKLESGIGKNFDTGLKALESVSNSSVLELGGLLMPQIEAALEHNLDAIVPKLQQLLAKKLSGKQVIQEAIKLLPKSLTEKLNPEKIAPILDGLTHDQPMQLQALLSAAMPEGFSQVQNLIGLDLQGSIGALGQIFSKPLPSATAGVGFGNTATTVNPLEAELKRRTEQLFAKLPTPLRRFIQPGTVTNLIRGAANSDEPPLQHLLGHLQKGMAGDTFKHLSAAIPYVNAIQPARQLIQGLKSGNVGQILKNGANLAAIAGFGGIPGMNIKKPAEVLGKVLKPLSGKLGGLFGGGKKKLNKLTNSIPGAAAGAMLRLTTQLGELAAQGVGPSAKMRVTPAVGELIGPGGINRIFTNAAGAGFKTPWGKFGFGSKGGSMLSQGMLAMRVAQSAGKAAGIVLDPGKGASISSFFQKDHQWDDEGDTPWTHESAKLVADNQTAKIQSLSPSGAVLHEVVVSPEGIFIDNVRIDWLIERLHRIEELVGGGDGPASTLEARIAALEARLNPANPDYDPATLSEIDGGLF